MSQPPWRDRQDAVKAPGVEPSGPEGQGLLNMLRGTGATLTLAGAGREAIAAWAAAARAAGFARVLAAPGPGGLTAEELAALQAAGIDGLRVRVYAAEAAAHDYHAGREGSFRATSGTLRAARTARLPVTVTTPLTRSNLRVLAAVPGLLVDAGALGWQVAVVAEVHAPGLGAVAPRLAVALPYALQAIVAAERAGLGAAIAGAPLCLLGPLRDRAVPSPALAFAEGCGDCGLRTRCPGVDGGYLRRFGPGELVPPRPGDARAGAGGPRAKRLQDMFSGPWLEVSEGACWPI
ncbi:hypothetical protein SAMN02745121_00560 [Nannocystis exedens]|uniref:Uncharacterized protein n=1 Tax=Nannocystis exedens TaxID=54 RepID=A0A1I1T8U7_9BACT|nr:hypothetical protein [Nannocystis exedens]PCC66710.1 Coenzyme PQQ synthesis protein E [Nannocystis exedens]SFD55012.1 hypothetical protein SAMN02745121_00560 [Nannocystis exedens]